MNEDTEQSVDSVSNPETFKQKGTC